MAITLKKRQKELKRLEKRREKEERHAQKKLAKRAEDEAAKGNSENAEVPAEPENRG